MLLDAHPVLNLVHTSTGGYLRLYTVYSCMAVWHGETSNTVVQGRVATKGDLRCRITVTLSIFNFRT